MSRRHPPTSTPIAANLLRPSPAAEPNRAQCCPRSSILRLLPSLLVPGLAFELHQLALHPVVVSPLILLPHLELRGAAGLGDPFMIRHHCLLLQVSKLVQLVAEEMFNPLES